MSIKITPVQSNVTVPVEINQYLHITRIRHKLYERSDMHDPKNNRILTSEFTLDQELVTNKVKNQLVVSKSQNATVLKVYPKDKHTIVVQTEYVLNNNIVKINIPYYVDDNGTKREYQAEFTYNYDNIPEATVFEAAPEIPATQETDVADTYPIAVAGDLNITKIVKVDKYDRIDKIKSREYRIFFDKDIIQYGTTAPTATFTNEGMIGGGYIQRDSYERNVIEVNTKYIASYSATMTIPYTVDGTTKTATYTLNADGGENKILPACEIVYPAVADKSFFGPMVINNEIMVDRTTSNSTRIDIELDGGAFAETSQQFKIINEKYGIPANDDIFVYGHDSYVDIAKKDGKTDLPFPDRVAIELVYCYRGDVRKMDLIINLAGVPRTIQEYGSVYKQLDANFAIVSLDNKFDLDNNTTTTEIVFSRDVANIEYNADDIGTITRSSTADNNIKLVLNRVRNYRLPLKITYNNDENQPIILDYILEVDGAPKAVKNFTAGNYSYETYKNAVVISYNVQKNQDNDWDDDGSLIANKATVNGTVKEVDNTPYDNYSPIANITHSVYNNQSGKYQFIIADASPSDTIVLNYETNTRKGTITLDIADFNELRFNFERSRFEHSEQEGKTLAYFQTNKAPTDVFIQKTNVERQLIKLNRVDRDITVAYDYGSFFNDDLQLYALLDNTKAYVQLDITDAPAEVAKTEHQITIEQIVVTNTVGNDYSESLFDSPSKTETKIIIDPTANDIDERNLEEIFGLRTKINYNGKVSVSSEIIKENGKLVLVFKDRLVSTDNFEITSVRNRLYIIPRFSDNFVTSRTIKHNIDDENTTVTIAFSKTLPAVTYGNEARTKFFDIKQEGKELIINTPKGKYLEDIHDLPTMVFTYNNEKTVEVWKWIKVPTLPLDKDSIKLNVVGTGFDQCTLFHYLDFTISDTQNVLEFNKGYKVTYCKIVDKLIKGTIERVVRLPKETPDTYRILFSEYPVENGGYIKLVPYTKDDTGDQASNPRVTAYLPLTIDVFPKPANKEKDVNTCAVYLKPNSDVQLKDFLYQIHTRDLLDKKAYTITAEIIKTDVNNDTAETYVQFRVNGEHERVSAVLQGIPAQKVTKQLDGSYLATIAAKARKGQKFVVTSVNSDGDVASYTTTLETITYKDISVEVLGGTVFTDLSGAILKVRIYPKPLKVEGVLGEYKVLGQGTDTEGVYQILYNTRVNYTDVLTVNIDIDDLNKRFVKYPVRLLDQIHLKTHNRGETANCVNQVRPVKQPIYIFYGSDDIGVNELTEGDLAIYGRVIYIVDNKNDMTKDTNIADAIAHRNLIPILMNNYIKDMFENYNIKVLGKVDKVSAQIKETKDVILSEAENKMAELTNKAMVSIADANKQVNNLIAKMKRDSEAAIREIRENANMPIGAVIAVANNLPLIPDGFLLCNGAAVSRETYKKLFSVIGILYGAGDNTTTFNLPDFRGCFLRGQGGNSAAFGIKQGDAIRNIEGSFNAAQRTMGAWGSFKISNTYSINMKDGGADSWGAVISFNAFDTVPTANENRPLNYAVNYLICYGSIEKPATAVEPPRVENETHTSEPIPNTNVGATTSPSWEWTDRSEFTPEFKQYEKAPVRLTNAITSMSFNQDLRCSYEGDSIRIHVPDVETRHILADMELLDLQTLKKYRKVVDYANNWDFYLDLDAPRPHDDEDEQKKSLIGAKLVGTDGTIQTVIYFPKSNDGGSGGLRMPDSNNILFSGIPFEMMVSGKEDGWVYNYGATYIEKWFYRHSRAETSIVNQEYHLDITMDNSEGRIASIVAPVEPSMGINQPLVSEKEGNNLVLHYKVPLAPNMYDDPDWQQKGYYVNAVYKLEITDTKGEKVTTYARLVGYTGRIGIAFETSGDNPTWITRPIPGKKEVFEDHL